MRYTIGYRYDIIDIPDIPDIVDMIIWLCRFQYHKLSVNTKNVSAYTDTNFDILNLDWRWRDSGPSLIV